MINLSESILSYKPTGADDYIKKSIDTGRERSDYMQFLLVPISNYTCVKVWRHKKYITHKGTKRGMRPLYHVEYFFFGKEKDVNTSIYLFNLFKSFIDYEVSEHKKSDSYKSDKTSPLTKINSFIRGLRHSVEDVIRLLNVDFDTDVYYKKFEDLDVEFNKTSIKLENKGSSTRHTTSKEHASEGSKRGDMLVKAVNRDIRLKEILGE